MVGLAKSIEKAPFIPNYDMVSTELIERDYMVLTADGSSNPKGF